MCAIQRHGHGKVAVTVDIEIKHTSEAMAFVEELILISSGDVTRAPSKRERNVWIDP